MPDTQTHHPSCTHVDAWNIPFAFSESKWPFYPTPCCGAAVSIFTDDGVTYCKACYGAVDPSLGGHPIEPYRPLAVG